MATLSMFAAAELAAQPVLTDDDFLSIGDRARMKRYAESPVAGLTAPGPGGDWDFTAALGAFPNVLDVECLAVEAGPVDAAQHFPGADRVIKLTTLPPPDLPPDLPPDAFPEFSEWNYYSCDPSGRTHHGTALPDPFGMENPFVLLVSPPTVEFPLPLTLGDQWTREYEAGDMLLNDVRVSSTVDAWGTATLPGIGTVECLRVNSEVLNELFDATVSPPVPLAPQYIRTYQWLAKGIGVVATISTGFGEVRDTFPDPDFTTAQDLQVFVDFTPAPVAANFIRGDVNGNGIGNIVDTIRILLYLFKDTPLPCVSAADLDDDGAVSTADAVYSLHSLFRRGPVPAAPFPSCGPDPTSDLPCDVSACP